MVAPLFYVMISKGGQWNFFPISNSLLMKMHQKSESDISFFLKLLSELMLYGNVGRRVSLGDWEYLCAKERHLLETGAPLSRSLWFMQPVVRVISREETNTRTHVITISNLWYVTMATELRWDAGLHLKDETICHLGFGKIHLWEGTSLEKYIHVKKIMVTGNGIESHSREDQQILLKDSMFKLENLKVETFDCFWSLVLTGLFESWTRLTYPQCDSQASVISNTIPPYLGPHSNLCKSALLVSLEFSRFMLPVGLSQISSWKENLSLGKISRILGLKSWLPL